MRTNRFEKRRTFWVSFRVSALDRAGCRREALPVKAKQTEIVEPADRFDGKDATRFEHKLQEVSQNPDSTGRASPPARGVRLSQLQEEKAGVVANISGSESSP